MSYQKNLWQTLQVSEVFQVTLVFENPGWCFLEERTVLGELGEQQPTVQWAADLRLTWKQDPASHLLKFLLRCEWLESGSYQTQFVRRFWCLALKCDNSRNSLGLASVMLFMTGPPTLSVSLLLLCSVVVSTQILTKLGAQLDKWRCCNCDFNGNQNDCCNSCGHRQCRNCKDD
jgi:hypothetical protein